jgi:hypothetical protein
MRQCYSELGAWARRPTHLAPTRFGAQSENRRRKFFHAGRKTNGYYYVTHILYKLNNEHVYMRSTCALRGCHLERVERSRRGSESQVKLAEFELGGRGSILPNYGSLVFFMIEKGYTLN